MESLIGTIAMFGFNFAPIGWALCDGSLLPISGNDALFSLLGTTYGGDGRTTFALPDLRGRVPIHYGSGPGLSPYNIGQNGGTENITLNILQLPIHNHLMMGSSDGLTQATAQGASLASEVRGGSTMPAIYSAGATNQVLMGSSVTQSGGNQQHTNMSPYLVSNYSIALYGIYPTRS